MTGLFPYRKLSNWQTDDKRYLFQFEFTGSEAGFAGAVRCTIFFVLPSTESLEVYNQVLVAPSSTTIARLTSEEPAYQTYSLAGTLAAFIDINQNTGISTFVIQANLEIDITSNIYSFQGPILAQNITSPPSPGPMPPPPPGPMPPAPIIEPIPFRDLFPYLFLSPWPQPDPASLALNFVTYPPAAGSGLAAPPAEGADPPLPTLYEALLKEVKDKTGAGKLAAEADAVSFIQLSAAYSTHFISSVSVLATSLQFYAAAVAEARTKGTVQFPEILVNLSGMSWAELVKDSESTAYQQELLSAWDSYFALMVMPGYRPDLCEHLQEVFVGWHTVVWVAAQFPAGEEVPSPLPFPDKMRQLLYASVALPAGIFPLPTSAPAPNQEWIEPYALGEMQMTRQRMLRYAPGEIASTFHVLPGEKKRLIRRSLRTEEQSGSETAVNTRTDRQLSSENEATLEQAVAHTLANWKDTHTYTNLNTTYSPANSMVVNGNYVVEHAGETPGQHKQSDFARKVLNDSIKNVSEKIVKHRWNTNRTETEETEEREIDNQRGADAIQGIYCWLNKIMEASVVQIGKRLVYLFNIESPAREYIAMQYNLAGDSLTEPPIPAIAGKPISTCENIGADNYLLLCATYGILAPPPPPAALSISETLTGNENKLIPIPAGYTPTSCTVTAIANTALTLQVQIGSAVCALAAGESAQPAISAKNNLQTLSFGATATQGTAAPPAAANVGSPPSPADAYPNLFMVSAEIVCDPTVERMLAWKTEIFTLVVQSYNNLKKEYFSNKNNKIGNIAKINPEQIFSTINGELKKKCILLMLSQAGILPQSSTQQQSGQSARAVQFLNQAFDWKSLTFSFSENYESWNTETVSAIALAGNSHLMTAFLQADSARVFVPVQPGFVHRVPFFLGLQALWAGSDQTAPVAEFQQSLVSALKATEFSPAEFPQVIDTWEFTLPTDLQIFSNTYF